MRRLIVPSSLLCLAAALCVLAMLGPAGAAGSVPPRVCPQQNGPMIAPCCPIPVNGTNGAKSSPQILPCCPPSGTSPTCCTPTTCCQSTTCCTQTACCATPCTTGGLTIASSPDPSTAGRKVVVSGGLTSNPAAAGATVVLWRELSGQPSFHQVAQTTTDSAGQYEFTLKRGTVNADQEWYVTANGLQSPTLGQHVNALVGLAGLHSVVVGQTLLLRGHVTPSHAGQLVLIEQRKGGRWTVIARPRLGRASNYVVVHRFMRSGTVALRTVLPGDARNDRSGSSILTVTVKP
jgi:hypothetical protein